MMLLCTCAYEHMQTHTHTVNPQFYVTTFFVFFAILHTFWKVLAKCYI